MIVKILIVYWNWNWIGTIYKKKLHKLIRLFKSYIMISWPISIV